MKKVVYIGLFISGLAITSCQKQDIAPATEGRTEAPSWDNTMQRGMDDDEDSKPDVDLDDEVGDGIVDPNADGDARDDQSN